jgi:putative aldouronate transport system substrate-binding protein
VGWVTKLPIPEIKYDPTIKIPINWDVASQIELINNETPTDNVMTKFLEKYLGIRFDPYWEINYGGEGYKQKWATALASNDLPDVMSCDAYWAPDVIFQLLRGTDILEDITDIWEKTASPLLKQKKGYPDGPLWMPFPKKPIKVIPGGGATVGGDELIWIRKDWLDKLSLKPPTTIQELHDLAKAFMDAKLAKVGYPLTPVKSTIDWMGSATPIFGAYGTMPTLWLKGDDGELYYGSIHPRCKEVLGLLRDWHKEGLFGEGFASRTGDDIIAYLASGQAGMTFGTYWFVVWPLPDTKTNDPNAEWAFYDIPAGPDGKHGRWGDKITSTAGWVFRKGTDPKKIEAVIHLANWMIERRTNWLQNQDYWDDTGPLFEGYNYVWDGDKLKAGPTPTAGPWAYSPLGPFFHQGIYYDHYSGIKKLESQGPKNEMEKFLLSNPGVLGQRDAYLRLYETKDWSIPDLYVGVPSNKFTQDKAL